MSLNQIENVKDIAILVGRDEQDINELAELAETAGVEVFEKIIQRNTRIDAAFFIGRGKLEELVNFISIEENINLIIFDHELSPAQLRNLEEKLEIKVIDRTQLILDIFAQHAHTRESKLQVELAQLEYMLPRLTGKGTELSRLGGGIGTRGPGETKLETDRRKINRRIHKLKNDLEDIKRNRLVQRKDRRDPIVALVGYTNAGKSTLLNRLTAAGKKTADMLFATLDSTLRKTVLPCGRQIIITDTVGFIKNLPHQLVASFRSTLEEIEEADIILHIIDSSHPHVEDQINVVNQVLSELNVSQTEQIMVFNKKDRVDDEAISLLELSYPHAVFLSALTGEGEEDLLHNLCSLLNSQMVLLEVELPYELSHLISKIYQNGDVIEEEYLNETIRIKAAVPGILAERIRKLIKSSEKNK